MSIVLLLRTVEVVLVPENNKECQFLGCIEVVCVSSLARGGDIVSVVHILNFCF